MLGDFAVPFTVVAPRKTCPDHRNCNSIRAKLHSSGKYSDSPCVCWRSGTIQSDYERIRESTRAAIIICTQVQAQGEV